jgi:hypothetical protein
VDTEERRAVEALKKSVSDLSDAVNRGGTDRSTIERIVQTSGTMTSLPAPPEVHAA